jgi:hypothetical protein
MVRGRSKVLKLPTNLEGPEAAPAGKMFGMEELQQLREVEEYLAVAAKLLPYLRSGLSSEMNKLHELVNGSRFGHPTTTDGNSELRPDEPGQGRSVGAVGKDHAIQRGCWYAHMVGQNPLE